MFLFNQIDAEPEHSSMEHAVDVVEQSNSSETKIQESTDHKRGIARFQAVSKKVTKLNTVVGALESAKFVYSMDAYKVLPRPASMCGGIVSILIWPATAVYVIEVLLAVLAAPKLSNNNIIWSIYGAPFPLIIRCEAAGGCLISNSNDTQFLGPCWNLSQGANLTLELEYFQNPLLGLSAIAWLDDPTAPIVSTLSQTYMPLNKDADSDGTMLLWSGILPGTTLVSMVATTNFTLHGSGRFRREWFGVLVDYSAAPVAGSSPCAAAASPASAAGDGAGAWEWRQARIRMQPSYNAVTVTNPSSVEQACARSNRASSVSPADETRP